MDPFMNVSKTTDISFIFSVENDFSPLETVAFVTVIMSVSVFTVVSNGIVVHLTRTSSELRPLGPLKSLLGSMALADLYMGLVIMPIACQYNVLQEWRLGFVGCRVFLCLEMFGAAASAVHLSAIAIDRYLAMMHPLIYRSLGRTYIYSSICVTWILSLSVLVAIYALDWYRFWESQGKDQCDIAANDTMILMVCVGVIGIPFGIIWSIYIRLYCASKTRLRTKMRKTIRIYQEIAYSRNLNRTEGSNDENVDEDEDSSHVVAGCVPCVPQISNAFRSPFKATKVCKGCHASITVSAIKSGLCKVCQSPNDLLVAATQSRLRILMSMNRRTLFVTLIVTSTFTICYVPIGIQYQIAAFYPTWQTYPRLTSALIWLAMGMAACNPIIYCAFNANFRRAFKKLLRC